MNKNEKNIDYLYESEMGSILIELQEGNKQWAKERLVELLEKYVVDYCRKKYYSLPNHNEDLIQESMVSVLEHIDEYQPGKGRLTTFFEPHIKSAMSKYCYRYILHTTDHYGLNIQKMQRVVNKLALKGFGFISSPEEFSFLAKSVGEDIPVKTAKECMLIMTRNENVNVHDPGNLYYMEQNEPSFRFSFENDLIDEMEPDDAIAKLKIALKMLSPEDQTILTYRFGLDGNKAKTIEEIKSIVFVPNLQYRIKKALDFLNQELKKMGLTEFAV